jgi:MFS family permease
MSEAQATTAILNDPASPVGYAPITSIQKKSLLAACLGWLFDGLDMHLYGLVAQPFVAILLAKAATDVDVNRKSSYIQAAFLVGWAVGGAFFGRLGDTIGRARALSLTILVYACFTGLSSAAQTWWQLMIFRFIAALGIGGEWAVGSSLLAETWPSRWRPWLAAILQTGVNIGVLLACATVWTIPLQPRYVFLVGILPAFIVFWIRRAVPEPEQWAHAAAEKGEQSISLLFTGPMRRITLLSVVVCACSLTAWWAFMFWTVTFMRNLPDVATWTPAQQSRLGTTAFMVWILISIGGNFFGGWLAKLVGYRNAIVVMLLGFFAAMFTAFVVPREHNAMLVCVGAVGFFSGVFGLFTMYLPPLFPTLIRTTGAGFSYNVGRVAAAAGTIIFGIHAHVNLRGALLVNSFLIIPAAIAALFLPNTRDA